MYKIPNPDDGWRPSVGTMIHGDGGFIVLTTGGWMYVTEMLVKANAPYPYGEIDLPLMVATAMLLESGLSFLALGVRPPEPSWGTMIRDGVDLLRTRPTIAIAPGFMIVVSVACLNLLGDAVRDAFDPHAKLREVST